MKTVKYLFFKEGYLWQKLPNWASLFMDMGNTVGKINHEKGNLLLGISAPTRAYIAPLVATGSVSSRFLKNTSDGVSLSRHFEQLCNLDIGTPLFFNRGNRRLKGLYDGTEVINGEKRVRIKISHGKFSTDWELVPEARSLSITIANMTFSIPQKQKGYKLIGAPDFVKILMPKVNLDEYYSISRLECLLIGPLTLLRKEITDTVFGAATIATTTAIRRRIVSGTLQDILRVRCFLGDGKDYKSDIYPSTKSERPAGLASQNPHTVIFDGAIGFIKWRDEFPNSHWVVVLDRTERGFDSAAQVINQEFMNRSGDIDFEIKYPSAIEFVAFER